MVYIEFIYKFFDSFTDALERFFLWMNRPMLNDWAISFLDQLPVEVLDFFGVSSFSEFTYTWALGVGLTVICGYTFITWLLNLLP